MIRTSRRGEMKTVRSKWVGGARHGSFALALVTWPAQQRSLPHLHFWILWRMNLCTDSDDEAIVCLPRIVDGRSPTRADVDAVRARPSWDCFPCEQSRAIANRLCARNRFASLDEPQARRRTTLNYSLRPVHDPSFSGRIAACG